MNIPTRLGASLAAIALTSSLAACGDGGAGGDGNSVRLGYFPNVTHATALVGLEEGIFAKELGPDVKLETRTYNAGPAAIEALFADGIDATYIGPSPTITGFTSSKGEALKVVAGGASGGAALVVKPEITKPEQLRGRKLGTPQLGNTQDVALRYWLQQQGLQTTKEGGGDVSIAPQENAQILEQFRAGDLDGAWVPEPWVTRLVSEGGGKVLVDERTLWPGKQFITTNLIVRTEFLKEHPDLVKKLVAGSVASNAFIAANPAKAQGDVSTAIGKLTGKPLDPKIIEQAWQTLSFTDDPLPSTLITGADHAKAVGLLDEVSLTGLYDLGPLNEALTAAKKPTVTQP